MTSLSRGFTRKNANEQPKTTRTLLVVDDEQSILSALSDLLRGRCRVLVAGSGEEALTLVRDNDISVVISDQRMPSMTGAELLAHLANTKPEVTRILLTGYADLTAVVNAVNQGRIYAYLTKPWDPSRLETVLEKAFEHHELLVERRLLIQQLQAANEILEARVAARTRELAEKNSALEALNAEQNELLGIAAHDLRNPLGVISAYSQLLATPHLGSLNDKQMKLVSTIHSTSQFMHRLLEDVLDFSKIEAGHLNLDLERSNLVEIVTNNVALNAVLADDKNIHLDLKAPEDAIEVDVDGLKIEQVLNNLIGNAIKFAPPDSEVTVTVGVRGVTAFITVQDQGPGIPLEEQRALFKPFSRTSVSSTAGEKCTGLGLAIVRKIVNGHGGSVSVESEPGAGTTFRVELPLARKEGRTVEC